MSWRRLAPWLIAGLLPAPVAPMRLKPQNFRYTAQLISLTAVLGVAGLSVFWPLLKRRAVRVAVRATRPDLFPEVHRISISDNYVSAGDTLIVCRTPWTRYPPVLHPVSGPRRWRWPA